MQYNPGNYEKYMTKNPLKRKMVENLNEKIVNYITQIAKEITKKKGLVRILDAGCGEGFITDLIYRNVEHAQITGLEYTKEALDLARQMNPDIDFVEGDIYQLPFCDNTFDIVLCTEVLEHLNEPERALSEMARVADHTVFLTVPNEPWFCMGNLVVLKNVSRLGNPVDHVNHWTYRGFVKYITAQYVNFGKKQSDRSFPWTIMICRK
ncbi:MAG: class I SAM-dependent methyltransferase [Suilimivivens sp.]